MILNKMKIPNLSLLKIFLFSNLIFFLNLSTQTNAQFINEINFDKNFKILGADVISGYPVEDKDLCLKEIKRLKKDYNDVIKGIGFSGHHKGIAADIAALAYGAIFFERHFTLDRTWKGTDHAASLEPGGLQKLVRDLNSTYLALNYKSEEILDIEAVQREKLKYRA